MGLLAGTAFIYGLPVINQIVDHAIKVGFEKLKSKAFFFRLFSELGINDPEDNFQSLYLHTVFLYASRNKPKELVKLMFLKSANQAFKTEFQNSQKGTFKQELDHQLHINQEIREIKNWNEVNQAEIDEFFDIFLNFVTETARPMENHLLNTMQEMNLQTSSGLSELQAGISKMLEYQERASQVQVSLATNDSSDLLQQEFDRQVNIISKAIAKGKYKDSLFQLRELKKVSWDNADSSVRFKILTNIAVCTFELGESTEAANHLIEAYTYDPESEIALCNVITAHHMLGNQTKAEEHLQILLEKYGETSDTPWQNLLNISPADQPLDQFIDRIPEKFRNNASVLEKIGLGYQKRGQISLATEYLGKAYSLNPKNGSIVSNYLRLLLESYNFNFKVVNQRIIDDAERTKMDFIIGLIDDQLKRIKDSDINDEIVFLLLSKSFLLNLLGESIRALETIDRALALEPNGVWLHKQKAIIHAYSGNPDKAISILENIANLDELPDGLIFLAESYRNVGKIEEAIRTLEGIIETQVDPFYVPQAKDILVTLYIQVGRAEKIEQLQRAGFDENDILERIILSRIQRFLGEAERANATLRGSKKLINEASRYKEVYVLAEELENVGLISEAIELYETIADRDTVSRVTQTLYRLYYRIGEKFKALSILSNLRKKSGPLEHSTKHEIIIYQEYSDYSTAQDIAVEYLEKYPDNLSMQLILCGLDIRLENFSRADKFLDREVDFLTLSHDELAAYARQLLSRNKGEKILRVLYEYRRERNDAKSNDLYLHFILEYPVLTHFIANPDTVEIDSAVGFSYPNSPSFVMVVEDRKLDERLEDEIVKEDPMFDKLLGRKIGDKVVFENSVQREWEITAIGHKYLHV